MPKRDSLARLVEQGDRERAVPSRMEPERLILPPRPPAQTRQICYDCRRAPRERAWAEYNERYFNATTRKQREDLVLPKDVDGNECPHCGGQLVQVTG